MRAAVPPPSRAYDIEILPRGVGTVGADQDHGWVFGLPRGIKTEDWPLDPLSGSPLLHGLTLWLPEDYRCRGSDVAGFAFFGTAPDQYDGGGESPRPWSDMIMKPGNALPDNPAWHQHWHQARSSAARTRYFIDVIGYAHAVIFLSEAEMNGISATPPDLSALQGPEPEWRKIGARGAVYAHLHRYEMDDLPASDADCGAASPLSANHGLRMRPRSYDPNAGKTFEGDYSTENNDLVDPFLDIDDDTEYLKNWARSFRDSHLGGTMLTFQYMNGIGPFYVEFGEHFGGFNFALGLGRLDLQRMAFEWERFA